MLCCLQRLRSRMRSKKRTTGNAGRDAWRIRESALLLLGLLGGWPGAVLAQQWLRHKSAKPSLRNAFWLTVLVNTSLFVVLSSPRFGAWSLLR